MELPKLQHPATVVVAGPTSSGKTVFLKKLSDEHMFEPTPSDIVWFYSEYQDLYDDMPDVTFVEGLPSDYASYIGQRTLFIIDDLMCELGKDKRLPNLFVKSSHHRNLSVIFIGQNFFHKGSQMRDISLNAHYLVLFKNARDKSQVQHLARQMYPGQSKFFQEVFEDATKKPFGYLLVDLKPMTEDGMRLRTGIFPNDTHYVYSPK